MTKVNYRWNELASNSGSGVGSNPTVWYVYDSGFAINTNGLTEDQDDELADKAYAANGNRPAAYTCRRDEIPAEYMAYEGQALKDYFNL